MKQSRAGVSLIEIVIAMTVASVILSGGIGVIHMLLDIDRSSRHALELTTTVSRLSFVFRRDVHAAKQVQASANDDDGPTRLRLQQPNGQSVTYEVHANRLVRTQRDDTERGHQDEFIFPSGFQIGLDARQTPVRVSVSVRHAGHDTSAGPMRSESPKRSPRSVRIEATLGRDYRFASTEL